MSTYTLFLDETGDFSREHSLIAGFAIKSKKTFAGEKSLQEIQEILLENFIREVNDIVAEVHKSNVLNRDVKKQILNYEFCHCSKNGEELIQLRKFIQPKLLGKLLATLKSLEETKFHAGNKIESVSIVIFKRGIEVDVFEIGPVGCVLNSENYLMTLAKGFIQFWMQKYKQDYKTNFRIYPSKRNIGDKDFIETYRDEKKLGSITVGSYVKELDKAAGGELYDNDLRDFHKILQIAVYNKPADESDSSNKVGEERRYEDYNRDLVDLVAKEEKTDDDIDSILKVLGHDECSTGSSIKIYFPNISLLQPRPDLSYKYNSNGESSNAIGVNDIFTVYCDYICNSLRYSKYWVQAKNEEQENEYDKAFNVFKEKIDIFDAFPTAKYDEVYFHDFITNKKVYELICALLVTPDILRSYKKDLNKYITEYKSLIDGRYKRLIDETKELYLNLNEAEQQEVLNKLVMTFRKNLKEYDKAQINEIVLNQILEFFQTEKIKSACITWIEDFIIDFKIFQLKALLNQNKLKDACILASDISKSMNCAENMSTDEKKRREKYFSILQFNLLFALSQHKNCIKKIKCFLKGFYSDSIDEEIGKAINISFASMIATKKSLRDINYSKDGEKALKQFERLPSYAKARTYQNLAQLSIMNNEYESAFYNFCLSILMAKGFKLSDLIEKPGFVGRTYSDLFADESAISFDNADLIKSKLTIIMPMLHTWSGDIDGDLKFNYIVFLNLLITSETFRGLFKSYKQGQKGQKFLPQCLKEALYPDCSIYLKFADFVDVIDKQNDSMRNYFDIDISTKVEVNRGGEYKKHFIEKSIRLFGGDKSFGNIQPQFLSDSVENIIQKISASSNSDFQLLSRKLVYISALARFVLAKMSDGEDHTVLLEELRSSLSAYKKQVDKFNDGLPKEFQFANPLSKINLSNNKFLQTRLEQIVDLIVL